MLTSPAKLSTDDANNLIPGTSFVVKTAWSPKEPQFELLNTVTDRGKSLTSCTPSPHSPLIRLADRFVFFTVMCHLALEMLTEPIALSCVCRAKVFRQEENFWLPPDRRPCTEDVNIQLTEVVDENKGWIFMNRLSVLNLSSPFSDVMRTLNSSTTGVTEGAVPQHPTPSNSPINHGCPDSKADNEEMPNGTCNPEDDDEPLMSGNGVVINDVTDDQLVVAWGALMAEWQTRLNAAPPTAASASLPPPPSADDALLCGGAGVEAGPLAKRIRQLVRRGIPDVLRAETWQMLAGHPAADPGLIEVYRILLTKPCRFDTDIQRDLPRTFPAHDFFRDRQGQEILFQITRAYALYDEDVGYCQGISFIAAALLLHLPEKQAFCLLVKIMSNYGTRLLFMQNCEGLFRCLHQFECLLADQLPDVAKAFNDLGIKAHMYASQWFLTLFMTKFPINLVFRILDIFLCDGLLFIFKVMISLLKVSRRDLLGLDFEGTLKFFRVTLPKRFRSREACDQLIFTASTAKVSATKLIRFAKDWERTKMEEADSTSPLRALQREVWELREQCSRLEKENEMLAEKVLTSKAGMQRDIDKLDDMVETLKIELFNSQRELVEKEEECKLLENDTAKVKEMFRQTLERHQLEHQQQQSIIEEYKTITSNLSKRVEKEADSASSGLPQTFIDAVLSCSGDCRRTLDAKAPGWSTNTFNLVADANNADSSVPSGLSPLEDQVAFLARRVKELELELAQSKVHLVDEQCMSQELNHQLVRAAAELEELKASNAASLYNPRHWLAKKWTTVTSRNATAAAAPASSDGAFRFQTD
ncbi:unnamed protein product [Mesocestoides corti]|uniref:Rab-GAP TBC domain-containing protein n=2 Tax=Mesocestoides corti TaxID=53468 RepID=A0A3P6HPZ0_MESCO|nr:unnamed protein product [Mesocestoides corti]